MASDVRAAVVGMFRPRYEDVVACEDVMLISKGGTSTRPKPRVAVLSTPAAGSPATPAESNTLYILEVKSKLSVKEAFRVSKLVDVVPEGAKDDASSLFDFGSSGAVVLSFESSVQQDAFVAEARRLQRQVQSALLGPVDGDESATTRVDRTTQEQSGALTNVEEMLLSRQLGPNACDDITAFEDSIADQQRGVELHMVKTIVDTADIWREVRRNIVDLTGEVEAVERRIESYATHLISKKAIIHDIEHANNTLHRKERNLENLHGTVQGLSDKLSMSQQMLNVLEQLQREKEKLVEFFVASKNGPIVAAAMKQMQDVLRDEDLEKDFPIKAVAERKKHFLKERKLIVQQSKLYILALIEIMKSFYLTDDTQRYSSRGRIILRPHKELTDRLLAVGDITQALAIIDMEGFSIVLRKYRASMQQVYAREISCFFTEMRKRVKRVGWAGQTLLGQLPEQGAGLGMLMESGQLGATPSSVLRHQSSSYFSPLNSTYKGGGGGGATLYSTTTHGTVTAGDLYIELPEANLNGRRLQRGALKEAILQAAATTTVAGLTERIKGRSGGGAIRPDIAFAMALEATLDVVLKEEEVLSMCFGLYAEKVDHSALVEEARDKASTAAAKEREARVEELAISLLELFGGELVLNDDAKESDSGGDDDHKSHHDSDDDDDEDDETRDRRKRRKNKEKATSKANYLPYELRSLVQFMCDNGDRIYTFAMMCMIDACLKEGTPSGESKYCRSILCELRRIVARSLSAFVEEQTNSLAWCMDKFRRKPSALLPCFAQLPNFLRRMDNMHNALDPEVVSFTNYDKIVSALISMMFDMLDSVSSIRGNAHLVADEGGSAGADGNVLFAVVGTATSLVDNVMDTAISAIDSNAQTDGALTDSKAVKLGFLTQFRHHSFFCVVFDALPHGSHAKDLLAERYLASIEKKDRYEELYITRLIFAEAFPVFSRFVLQAEDLVALYTSEQDLSSHRVLAEDNVRRVCCAMKEEFMHGIADAAQRMTKHFTRDIKPQSTEHTFHRTILAVAWKHFTALVADKVGFMCDLLQKPMYKAVKATVTQSDLRELINAAQ